MRELTLREILKLAYQEGAKDISVENFLCLMGKNKRKAWARLEHDAEIHKWGSATIGAIAEGIIRASKKEEYTSE